MEGSGPSRQATRADVAVLIPALNAAATIADVVAGARAYVGRIYVVDDGSSDATAAVAERAGAIVLRHARCGGKGAALQTGMHAAATGGAVRLLTMDADGQHLPREIPALLQASDADPAALVIGVRRIAPGATTPMRLFGNRFANRWVEIACGVALPDTQSGFRIYPLAAVLALRTRARHFAFETEVLIRAVRAGLRIVSVPVHAYYPPPEERISYFRPLWDTVRMIFVVLGLIFRVW